MKNLMKIIEIATLRRAHSFQTIKYIDIRLGHNQKENSYYDRIPLKGIIILLF